MTEGQINLPSGVQCIVGGTRLTESSIRRLVSVTKDRQVAYSALFARTVEGSYADVSDADVLALERAVVAAHFHGSSSAYRAALAKEGANVAVARGILGDELRQARSSRASRSRSRAPRRSRPSTTSSGACPARQVGAAKAPWWLGARKTGVAISSVAPDQVFQVKEGRWTTVVSASGQWKVKPLGPVAPLAAFSLAKARPSIGAALRQSSRTSAYQTWTAAKQRSALKQTVCRRDALPSVGRGRSHLVSARSSRCSLRHTTALSALGVTAITPRGSNAEPETRYRLGLEPLRPSAACLLSPEKSSRSCARCSRRSAPCS